MKVQVYSQWREDAFVPARVRQFTKAARLMGHSSFREYADQDVAGRNPADRKSAEYQAVAQWLDSRANESNVAESVA